MREEYCKYGFKHVIKTPIEIIKKGTFGGTYFRGVYSNINKNGTKIFGKNLFS